jgi:hypothetical protein
VYPPKVALKPEIGNPAFCPGVNGENDRQVFRDFCHCHDDFFESFRVVNCCCPMESKYAVRFHIRVAAGESEPVEYGRLVCFLTMPQEAIDHDVANEMNFRIGDSFALKILIRTLFCGEELVRDRVSQDTIYLFRHCPVKTAEAGLYVNNPDAQLRGNKRTRDCRVHIPNDQNMAGLLFEAYWLESRHDLGCLHGMRSRSDLEVDIGRRDPELLEKESGQLTIVVLAGMNEELLKPFPGVRTVPYASMIGPIFMKFGRAPTTFRILMRMSPLERFPLPPGCAIR